MVGVESTIGSSPIIVTAAVGSAQFIKTDPSCSSSPFKAACGRLSSSNSSSSSSISSSSSALGGTEDNDIDIDADEPSPQPFRPSHSSSQTRRMPRFTRRTVEELSWAFNRKDYRHYASFFSPTGRLSLASGPIIGREAIASHYLNRQSEFDETMVINWFVAGPAGGDDEYDGPARSTSAEMQSWGRVAAEVSTTFVARQDGAWIAGKMRTAGETFRISYFLHLDVDADGLIANFRVALPAPSVNLGRQS